MTYARRLDVLTFPDKQKKIINHEGRLVSEGSIPDIQDYLAKPVNFVPNTVGPFLGRHLAHWYRPGLDHMSKTPGYYAEQDWKPLVFLIVRLDRLAELHYSVDNMFPRCLLQAIHEHHPGCQLNIWSFQTLSLNKPGLGRLSEYNTPRFADSFDLEVLRSPCLHAIGIDYAVGDEEHQYPIIPLIAMAPNLKHLHVRCLRTYFDRKVASVNQLWTDFVNSVNPLPLASLASVSFFGPGSCKESALLKWS